MDLTDASKKIFEDVCLGLQYLHDELKFAHRDIKPDNILFVTQAHGTNDQKPDRAQIADFTCVCELPAMVTDHDGTPAFLPPEAHESEEYDPSKQDMFALGVSMYCFCFGKLPFEKAGEYNLVIPTEASDSLKELLSKLMSIDPNNRPTASEALEFDYFTEL